MKLWICLFLAITAISGEPVRPTPVVLWHGMGDTCCGAYSLGKIKLFIEKSVPGIFVASIRIGNSTIEDFENGYFKNPNKQVMYACESLAKHPKLSNGFNVIGFSQGSQFLRAVVQRCGHALPPIRNLITIGGQHQGVYGIPQCGALQHKSCEYLREAINHAAYESWVQEALVQATYWHDPLNEPLYREKSIFLSDINNEMGINKTYIENLNRLDKFVMVMFNQDTIVQPKETEWFGFYRPGQANETMGLRESKLYIEDRLGLKKMDKDGKLDFLSVDGNHLRMSDVWFLQNIITPYLNETYS